MNGFFSKTSLTVIKAPTYTTPRCGACGIYKLCKSPKMEPSGEGRRRILIVAEAPGKDEDSQGVPLVGKDARLIRDTLAGFGVDMRRDCWSTNALICRPPHDKIPNDKVVDYCRPNLVRTITELQPDVIIPIGQVALQSLIPYVWKDDVESIGRWVGWVIPSQKVNAWICPTFHPSDLSRSKDTILPRLFKRYLKRAVGIEGKPWKEIPDYKKSVKIILDPEEAASHVRLMMAFGQPLAFDFETTTLKPDGPHARIHCCSVSDGHTSVAFPWQGEAIVAVRQFIKSTVPKIGFNLKFEDRYARKILGCGINKWDWCGMTASHVLDNRPLITSLKFQSFVRFGIGDYSSHIEPYLKSETKGGNEPNRITEVDIETVLMYCGLDSLFEHMVAADQKKEMGYGVL